MGWRSIAFALGLALAAPAASQELTISPQEPAAPLVLIVDTERLYVQSAYAESLRAAVEVEAEALKAENEKIVAALTEEERSLTERRPTMDGDVFRAEAAAFDAKVQDIRQARDAKEAALNQSRADIRLTFFDEVRPLIGQLMVDRGAVAVIDSRSVVVAVRSVDITADAIDWIDSTLLTKD